MCTCAYVHMCMCTCAYVPARPYMCAPPLRPALEPERLEDTSVDGLKSEQGTSAGTREGGSTREPYACTVRYAGDTGYAVRESDCTPKKSLVWDSTLQRTLSFV